MESLYMFHRLIKIFHTLAVKKNKKGGKLLKILKVISVILFGLNIKQYFLSIILVLAIVKLF